LESSSVFLLYERDDLGLEGFFLKERKLDFIGRVFLFLEYYSLLNFSTFESLSKMKDEGSIIEKLPPQLGVKHWL